jgi:phage terminase large subunit
MPLIDGKVEPLVLPSEKHARVIFDQSKKWRYRVMYGGRNGYKDWSFSAAAIERGVRVSTRFLFTREIQLTIADSAHKLLCDTIRRLGYSQYFTITNNKIECNINETSFVFRGLNDLVSDDIKSMEGIDICAICEAQNLTEKSFIDLDPTIRKKGSEIWIMFNTKMETDFVYDFCVKNPPENMICEKVNYTDTDAPAEMLSAEIIEQAERMRRDNLELYNNIWLGEPLTLGLFFGGFGPHNAETPFVIANHDTNERLIGSLDHGIAHNTSFGLHYLDNDGYVHRIFTYSNNGGTTQSHAEAICDALEGCYQSRHNYPSEIFYDYAMDEKHAVNERIYLSDLDVYRGVFSTRPTGKNVKFIPANKRKVDGCHAMIAMFDKGNGLPILRYFKGMNDAFVLSIKNVIKDKTNPEVYAKIDGDDETDEFRYAAMGIMTRLSARKSRQAYQARTQNERITPIRKQLAPLFFSQRKVS